MLPVGIFTSPDGAGDGSGEASLRRCGRNLSISGWGGGGLLGGKPAYGTAVGSFTSPDGAREGPAYGTAVGIFTSPDGAGDGSGKPAYRHCGRNLYVSGWDGGGLGGSQPTALR